MAKFSQSKLSMIFIFNFEMLIFSFQWTLVHSKKLNIFDIQTNGQQNTGRRSNIEVGLRSGPYLLKYYIEDTVCYKCYLLAPSSDMDFGLLFALLATFFHSIPVNFFCTATVPNFRDFF